MLLVHNAGRLGQELHNVVSYGIHYAQRPLGQGDVIGLVISLRDALVGSLVYRSTNDLSAVLVDSSIVARKLMQYFGGGDDELLLIGSLVNEIVNNTSIVDELYIISRGLRNMSEFNSRVVAWSGWIVTIKG